MIDWLDDWLIGWLIEWMVDWMNGWLNEWLNEWLIEWMVDWMNGWLNEWLTESLMEWFCWLIDWFCWLILLIDFVDWVVDWLIDCLIVWLFDWLFDWLIDWSMKRLSCCHLAISTVSLRNLLNGWVDRSNAAGDGSGWDGAGSSGRRMCCRSDAARQTAQHRRKAAWEKTVANEMQKFISHWMTILNSRVGFF